MSKIYRYSNIQLLDANGDPLAGAKLNFYEAGTSTPLNTYSDNALSSANANPVVADANGRFGEIFLADDLYKVVGTDSSDVEVFSEDNIDGGDGTETIDAGTAGGTADALTLTVSGVTAYETNLKFRFIVASDNATTTPTVNINGIGAKTIVRSDGGALVAGDLKSAYKREISYISSVDKFQLVVADGTDGTNGTDGDTNSMGLVNVGLAASVGSNALTVALKGQDGNDPSASNAVKIDFRSATATDGGSTQRSVTGALSVVISAGSTLGFTTSQTSRLYVVAIDNAGTVELGIWHPLSGTSLKALNEADLQSSTAEGGAGGADSAQTLYSTSARTSKAIRILGWIEIQTDASTAGNWSNAPSKIQPMGDGVPRTGDFIQDARTVTGAFASGTTAMPSDDTIPQNTEGDQYMSQAITPTSAINMLDIEVNANTGTSSTLKSTGALFQDSTAGALAATQDHEGVGNHMHSQRILHRMVAGTASSTTFKFRAGHQSGATFYFNGVSGARLMGGVMNSWIHIREIFT